MIGRPTQETGYSLEQLIQTLVQDFTLQKKRKRCDSLFSFFLQYKNKQILVVGGGVIAQRRIQTLLRFGCQITMITPECTDILRQHANKTHYSLFPYISSRRLCFF